MKRLLLSLVLVAACGGPDRVRTTSAPGATESTDTPVCTQDDSACLDCTPPSLRVSMRRTGWSGVCGTDVARVGHTAVVLGDGTILVAGGNSVTDVLETTELFDPVRGDWREGAPMSTERAGHTATLLTDGRVLVVGGDDGGTAEIYDPRRETWERTTPLGSPRGGHTATRLQDGRVLVVGGEYFPAASVDYLGYSTSELYDPATGTWSEAGDGIVRSNHTATLLLDGRVLVAGGESSKGGTDDCAVFDPETMTWSDTLPMLDERWDHSATILGDGRVLVSGGLGGMDYLGTAEVWDPAGGRWAALRPMQQPRAGHTSTLLGDGRVIVVGGEPTSRYEPLAEAFDATLSEWSAMGRPMRRRNKHATVQLGLGALMIVGGLSPTEANLVGEPTASSEILTLWTQ